MVEAFRLKEWNDSTINITIPVCTDNVANTNIPKTIYTLTGQESVDYKIVGMLSYEVMDANGNRINCWPVCQFTGGGLTELHVRWMCAGTTPQVAARISAKVLIQHR